MDRRLGAPLPHQLPNPARADPKAMNLSPAHISVNRAHPVLATVSSGCPEPRGTFPRVTHPCAAPPAPEGTLSRDLHVLGLPPAFVLSQDQTLRFRLPPGVQKGQSDPKPSSIDRAPITRTRKPAVRPDTSELASRAIKRPSQPNTQKAPAEKADTQKETPDGGPRLPGQRPSGSKTEQHRSQHHSDPAKT